MFDSWRGFAEKKLTDDWHQKLTEQARVARGHILTMTTLAGSGHPGGSMSSLEVFLSLYTFARLDPKNPADDERDRIIVSHGHTSPGVYSSLAAVGFIDIEPVLHGFRQGGSPFEGHVEQSVPGVEWDTGNLGQGLSAGLGKAVYARLSGKTFHTYVVMGDGEQQKGQISEARRLAAKYAFNNVTAIVDYNKLQISGSIDTVLPIQIKADWEADGWQVREVDGHDLNQVYDALYEATHNDDAPIMILARTTMGKGVSFMENKEKYHGSPISEEQLAEAFEELGGSENDLAALKKLRAQGPPPPFTAARTNDFPTVHPGTPITLGVDEKSDNRSAWGKALLSVAQANASRDDFAMAVFDCDLAGSVKTTAFAKEFPDRFFQCGITEHSTATMAGALSAEKALSVWADFAAFGIDETYNQARLNDINHSNLKLVCTHTGVDVGEDGKTHQCIDFYGLLNSTFGWKVITPGDPNQTDRAARYILTTPGNFAMFMGRSKVPIITDESGKPFFGESYTYEYGRMDMIRKGEDLALVSSGNILHQAFGAWNLLKDSGVNVTLISVSDWSDLHADDLAAIGAHRQVVTLEDHNVKTGLGARIGLALFEAGMQTNFTRLGVTGYAASGKPQELYKLLGIDAESVARKVRQLLERQAVSH